MPHRGANSEDHRLFNARSVERIKLAVEELSWLLTRGYAVPSAMKLVGDRHLLHARQLVAVFRASCNDEAMSTRMASRITTGNLEGRELMVDGFNVLITLEAALSHGVLLRCRDGCLRDIASVHGNYRFVDETNGAIDMMRLTLDELEPASVTWLLDSPVSNSGRLAARMREFAETHALPWTVETVFSPDRELKECGKVVATTDGIIIDTADAWVDLALRAVEAHVPDAWIVDLSLV